MGWWPSPCGLREAPHISLRFPILLLLFQLVSLEVQGSVEFEIVEGLTAKSVVEGGNVALHCRFSSKPTFLLWHYSADSSSEGMGFQEVAVCANNGPCVLKSRFVNYSELVVPNNGSLIILSARRLNDGFYKCQGFLSDSRYDQSSTGRLTVKVPPGTPTLNASNNAPLVDDVVTMACTTTGGNPAPILRWRWLLASGTLRTDLSPQTTKPTTVFGTTTSKIVVKISVADHLSVVQCEAYSVAGNKSSSSRTLMVRRLPGKARISTSTSEPFENNGLFVNCSSVGGNPKPRLLWSWTRADSSLRQLPSPTIFEPDRPFGTTVSQLRLEVDHRDNGAQITCVAENNVGRSESTFKTLNVIYKPRVMAFRHNPLSVLEAQPLRVECRVTGNPAPRVKWSKEGVSAVHDVTGSTLSFSRLDRSNAGLYKCRAENRAGTSEMQLELRVLYPPSVEVPNVLTVREDHKLVLACRVRAYPRADVRWIGPDGDLVGGVAGPTLRIEKVTRKSAGRYQCVAENQLVPSEGPTTTHTAKNGTDLKVKYLPGSPSIEITPSTSVPVGSDVHLLCTANRDDPGYPSPQLEWRSFDGSVLSVNGSMRIQRARLSDSGRYRCTPSNDVGAGPVREFMLQVEQAPQFVSDLKPLHRNLTLTSQDMDFSVYCTVRGKPIPKITWTRNSVPITGTGDLAILFQVTASEDRVDGDPKLGFQVKSILAWRGSKRGGERHTALRADDNGIYACEAINSRGHVSSQMSLTVLYPPVFVNPTRIVAADLSTGTVSLSCPVSSQPRPDRTDWFLADDRPVIGGSVPARFTVIEEPAQLARRLYTTVLTINFLTRHDLKLYRCRTRNRLGNNTLTVELRNQSIPETPSQLTVQSNTWESAFLSWTPGFDGGFPQTFDLVLVWANGEDHRKAISGDRYNLTNLLPNTTYVLRLKPVNKLGNGEPTPGVVLNTEALFIPRIQDVRLDLSLKRINFNAPPGYCVRVDVSRDRGATWLPFRDCLEPSDEFERVSSTAEEYRAALCLRRRRDVCSSFVGATISDAGPEVPMVVILAVAIACAVLIVILFAILLFFCLRRRPRRKEFEANPAHRRPQAVTINPYAPTPPNTGPAVLHHSPPIKPYAMVIPTSGAAMSPNAPAYENGAASFGGDDTDCGRSSRGRASPWDTEKRRSSPKVTSTFGVVIGMPGGGGGGDVGSVMTPHSNSSQDPLLASSSAPSEPPPYTDTVRRHPAGGDSGFELQPIGSRESNGDVYSTWGRDPTSPRSLTLTRTAVSSPAPSSTLPLTGGTCPRQPKKVIYEVVV